MLGGSLQISDLLAQPVNESASASSIGAVCFSFGSRISYNLLLIVLKFALERQGIAQGVGSGLGGGSDPGGFLLLRPARLDLTMLPPDDSGCGHGEP